MTLSPLRIGVVGAGRISQNCHIEPLQALPGVEIVALAELRPELGAVVAERFEIPAVYADHHELLKHRGLDAVVVVTRPQATGPVVADCLDRGVHVLSEKPMAHSAAQARDLIARVKPGQVYALGFMKRCDPGVQRARHMLRGIRADGRWGALRAVHGWSEAGDPGSGVAEFAMTPERRPVGLSTWSTGPEWLERSLHSDFGAFCNVHSHLINLLPWLLEDPLEIQQADLAWPDRRIAYGRVGGGATVTLTFGDRAVGPWLEGVAFQFEGGRLRIDLPAPFDRVSVAKIRVGGHGEATVIESAETGWAFARQASAFVVACQGGKPPMDGRDGVVDLEMTELLWQASATTSLRRT